MDGQTGKKQAAKTRFLVPLGNGESGLFGSGFSRCYNFFQEQKSGFVPSLIHVLLVFSERVITDLAAAAKRTTERQLGTVGNLSCEEDKS